MLGFFQELYEGLTRNAQPPTIDWSKYPSHPSDSSRSASHPTEIRKSGARQAEIESWNRDSRRETPVVADTRTGGSKQWERSLRLGIEKQARGGEMAGNLPSWSPNVGTSSRSTTAETPEGAYAADDTPDASVGDSFAMSHYEADNSDLLDQHVAHYFRHNDLVWQKTRCTRRSAGFYDINGRTVRVEWNYVDKSSDDGYLIVRDGPLSQPFCDYVENRDDNQHYECENKPVRALIHSIPMEKRISFSDQDKNYSRLEAMRVAKEQAKIREQAAEHYKNAGGSSDHLVRKYQSWHIAQLKQDAPPINTRL